MLPAFDEQALRERLTALPQAKALAFGAACAERILPNYLRFMRETGWGRIDRLRRALDLVWKIVETDIGTDEDVIRQILAECEATAPDSEDFGSLFTSGAQDACFAICNLLDFVLEKSNKCIVLAARYPTDSIDLYVQEVENIAPQDPMLESKILSHPLMQQELARQRRDLDVLQAESADAVGRVRRTSASEDVLQLASN
jgi:hypothetical protein